MTLNYLTHRSTNRSTAVCGLDPRFTTALRPGRAVCALMALAATHAAQAQERWTLTESLRIGGADAGPMLFVYTKGLEADARGRIYVYDRTPR